MTTKKTHIIQKGETLESIAEQYNILPEELRRFHNTYCDLDNLIEANIKGIHEILIPSPNEIIDIQEQNKKRALINSIPSYNLKKEFYFTEYSVSEQIQLQNKKPINITYSIFIEISEPTEMGYITRVSTSEFKKDGKIPDDKMSTLSQLCIESIFPIEFIVPFQGKIKNIHNRTILVKRFEDKRPHLEDFLIGKVAKDYFGKFYASLKSESYILKQYQSSLLYQVLFPQMEWFHKKAEWEEKFYLYPNSFPVICSISKTHNFDMLNDIETIIKGKIKESITLQELLRGVKFEEKCDNQAFGEFETCYRTSKINRQLKKIKNKTRIFHEEEIYYDHEISVVAVEIS